MSQSGCDTPNKKIPRLMDEPEDGEDLKVERTEQQEKRAHQYRQEACGAEVVDSRAVEGEDLTVKEIEVAGKYILETYCNRHVGEPRPTMLPPAPNTSKFIDKHPNGGLNEEQQGDKERREDYGAEVDVYRALERLKTNVIVLHGLSYTNKQYALFETEHKYTEPNKPKGECDFVVIGEKYIVVIEVSNVREDVSVTTDKGIRKAFNNKKKQREKMERLIIKAQEYNEPDPGNVFILCFTAFPSLNKAKGATVFSSVELERSIFKEDLAPSINNQTFQSWWKMNVEEKIDSTFKRIHRLSTILLGLWCIDLQNRFDPEERCSLSSNILRTNEKLKNAKITFSFGRDCKNSDKYENPEVVVADDVFKPMGIEYLTKEQQDVFRSEQSFMWLNGAAGTGKTILILGKVIKLLKEQPENRVVILQYGSIRSSTCTYYKSTLERAGIECEQVKNGTKRCWKLSELLDNIEHITSCAQSCQVVLVQLDVVEYVNMITEIVVKLGDYHLFIDDAQFLLVPSGQIQGNVMDEIKHAASTTRTLWVVSDIAQQWLISYLYPLHPSELGTNIPQEQKASLSRNLRNTYDISKLLSVIREQHIKPLLLKEGTLRNTYDISKLLSVIRDKPLLLKPLLLKEGTLKTVECTLPKQKSGHFIRGPKPTVHVVHANGDTSIRDVILEELKKLRWKGGSLEDTDIAIITDWYTDTLIEEEVVALKSSGDIGNISVCNTLDVYSGEWPAVICVIATRQGDLQFSYIMPRLYVAMSRARVYCSVILYDVKDENYDPEDSDKFNTFLNDIDSFAHIKVYSSVPS